MHVARFVAVIPLFRPGAAAVDCTGCDGNHEQLVLLWVDVGGGWLVGRACSWWEGKVGHFGDYLVWCLLLYSGGGRRGIWEADGAVGLGCMCGRGAQTLHRCSLVSLLLGFYFLFCESGLANWRALLCAGQVVVWLACGVTGLLLLLVGQSFT